MVGAQGIAPLQLKDEGSSELVIYGLLDTLEGKGGDAIYQNSGKQKYVSMQALLQKASIAQIR